MVFQPQRRFENSLQTPRVSEETSQLTQGNIKSKHIFSTDNLGESLQQEKGKTAGRKSSKGGIQYSLSEPGLPWQSPPVWRHGSVHGSCWERAPNENQGGLRAGNGGGLIPAKEPLTAHPARRPSQLQAWSSSLQTICYCSRNRSVTPRDLPLVCTINNWGGQSRACKDPVSASADIHPQHCVRDSASSAAGSYRYRKHRRSHEVLVVILESCVWAEFILLTKMQGTKCG